MRSTKGGLVRGVGARGVRGLGVFKINLKNFQFFDIFGKNVTSNFFAGGGWGAFPQKLPKLLKTVEKLMKTCNI